MKNERWKKEVEIVHRSNIVFRSGCKIGKQYNILRSRDALAVRLKRRVMAREVARMGSKYITLVFECDTDEKVAEVREVASREICRAWSMDHEIVRVDLLRQAINDGDMEKAQEYLAVDGAECLIGELR